MSGRGDQSGGAAVLLLAPVVIAAVVALVVASSAAAVLLAAGRAQDLADEAAIAGARAWGQRGAGACAAATRVVAGGGPGATVVACRVGPTGRAVVEVAVPVPSPLARGLGHRRAVAGAAAAPTSWP